MKNASKLQFAIGILVCSLLIGLLIPSDAYAQDNSLTGSWLVDVDKSVGAMTLEAKTRFDKLDEDHKTSARSTMGGRLFTFHEDGTVVVMWKSKEDTKESVGKWSSDNAAGTMTIIIDNRTQVFDFMLKENELKLVNHKPAGLFSTLCFTRQ